MRYDDVLEGVDYAIDPFYGGGGTQPGFSLLEKVTVIRKDPPGSGILGIWVKVDDMDRKVHLSDIVCTWDEHLATKAQIEESDAEWLRVAKERRQYADSLQEQYEAMLGAALPGPRRTTPSDPARLTLEQLVVILEETRRRLAQEVYDAWTLGTHADQRYRDIEVILTREGAR